MRDLEQCGKAEAAVDSTADGNAAVLSQVIERYERLARGVAFFVLGQTRDIDDVLQDVWLRLWPPRADMRAVKNWPAWLYFAVRNAAIDVSRSRRRRKNLWLRLTRRFTGIRRVSRCSGRPVTCARSLPPNTAGYRTVAPEVPDRVGPAGSTRSQLHPDCRDARFARRYR